MGLGTVAVMFLWGCSLGGGKDEANDSFDRFEPSSAEVSQPDQGPNTPQPGEPSTDGDTGPAIQGSINGVIDIQLFDIGEDGERDMITWEDAYGDFYPFGKIFVTAYYEDPNTGAPRYVGFDVIENPKPTGNEYSIPIGMDAYEELRVYAVLDYYIDNVTGTDEPVGGFSRTVSLDDAGVVDGTINDVSFAILSPLYEPREPCPNDRTIDITGVVTITETWTGGDVAVILMQPGNIGPVHYSIAQPTVLGGGAEAEYSLQSCENYGYMLLLGIWDENLNGMYDPMDEAGPYTSEPETSGNPISVGYSNLANYEIQIPMNAGAGLSLVPFISLSGEIHSGQVPFNELSEGGTLYVTALKYRPNQEISVSDILENSYDYQVFTADDLQGQNTVDWRLIVPSETITYLWAYMDSDNDGTLNEPQEPIASGGQDDNGKYPTGNYDTENIDMHLLVMDSE